MKYLLVLFIACQFLYAQEAKTTPLTIIEYDSKITPNKSKWIDENNKEISLSQQEKEMMAIFGETYHYRLITNGDESNFFQVHKIDNSQNTEGSYYTLFTNTDEIIMYQNTAELLYLEEQSIDSKNYIIKDELKNYDWITTDKKLNICGYEVQHAYYFDPELNADVHVYTTNEIQSKNGPYAYWSNNGVILKLTLEYADQNFDLEKIDYQCAQVSMDEKITLRKPNKGKLISRKDFNEKVQKLQERMDEINAWENEGVDISD